MKELWKKYAAKIDALTQRERIVVFVTTVIVVAFVMDMLLIDPSAKSIAALESQMRQQQSELTSLNEQVRVLEAAEADPDAALRAHRDSLTQQVGQVSDVIKGMQKDLVPAQKMNGLLQDMLDRNPRLQLVAMRTLPVTTVAEAKPAAPMAPNAENTTMAPAEHTAAVDDNIFKHGVEITLQGSYADLHDYLTRMERLPWRMFWAHAQLSTEDYPRLTLKITIYTISLDKAWLEV